MTTTMRLLCACAQLRMSDPLRIEYYPLLLLRLAEEGVGASGNDSLPVARSVLRPALAGGRRGLVVATSLAPDQPRRLKLLP
jgi:hypothetical protein